MSKSYKKEFSYLTLRKAIRERDVEYGNVLIVIKGDSKEKVFHEIITGLLESDTILSYHDTTGCLLNALVEQSSDADKQYSASVAAVQEFKESPYMDLFNIKSIILTRTSDIGETLFRSMTNTKPHTIEEDNTNTT
jgi:hypothetical protein